MVFCLIRDDNIEVGKRLTEQACQYDGETGFAAIGRYQDINSRQDLFYASQRYAIRY